MSGSPTYYLQRNGTEIGPLTIAQVNRMKQRREIFDETPCRPAHESAFRRLDEVLPHLKDLASVDYEKIAKIQQDIARHEIWPLIKIGFIGVALSGPPPDWEPLPLGVLGPGMAIGCGWLLLFKHRRRIGILLIALGVVGLVIRFYKVVW